MLTGCLRMHVISFDFIYMDFKLRAIEKEIIELIMNRKTRKQMGKNPKTWLAEQRQHHALELLCDGSSIKETAACLGYKQPTNFSRKYKNHYGICPSQQPPTVNLAQCPQMIQNVRI